MSDHHHPHDHEQQLDHVVVKLDGVGHGTVTVNGTPMNAVAGVNISTKAGMPSYVTLYLVASVEVDVMAEAKEVAAKNG